MARLPIISVLFLIIVTMQNCGPSSVAANGSKPTVKSALSGNGEGYGGKTYGNINRTGACADGEVYREKIAVDDKQNRAFVVRENCMNVPEREVLIADLNLLPHNQNQLVYESRVYDRITAQPGFSKLFCRGSEVDPQGTDKRIVDAVIKSTDYGGTIQYTGRVILGIYDRGGNHKKTYDVGEIEVVPKPGPVGQIIYTSGTVGNQQFNLHFDPSSMTAFLFYIGNIFLPSPLLSAGDSLSRPPTPSEFYAVSGLNCYTQ